LTAEYDGGKKVLEPVMALFAKKTAKGWCAELAR
jgi:hypothetical protein